MGKELLLGFILSTKIWTPQIAKMVVSQDKCGNAKGFFHRRFQPVKIHTRMYIIAIAWIFVIALFAITQSSPLAGLLNFLFLGLLPLCMVLWIVGSPARRRAARRHEDALLAAQNTERRGKDSVTSQPQGGE